jgi:beta-barrel assembly-enhancing protease
MKVLNPRGIFFTLWCSLWLNLFLLMMPLRSSAGSANPQPTQDVTSEQEEAGEIKTKKPTPAEIARLAKLAIADQLYLGGDKAGAIKLYREAKPKWQLGSPPSPLPIAAFTDPSHLSPAGQVFWRHYQAGKQQHLESKVLSSLKLLTTREPQFLLGHIYYAQALREYDYESEAIAALDLGVRLYPHEPEILKAKMAADIAEDKWLEASILARQFTLFNPDAPQAAEFARLATEYLAEYQSNLRSSITWNAVGNAIVGAAGFALTGDLFGPLSALQTTSLVVQGESAVGKASASQIKKQVPLLQDETVTEYINHIGQKISSVSGRDEFDYQFYVVMDDNLNALALPGGKVFVNAGAIMQTDSEAELAGLLAHEVSHSALSHGFQLTTKGNLTANIVSYLPYVGNTASSLIVLNYSREMEKQADLFGTRILVNAGYAADGVRNLMVKLKESQQKDDPEAPEWLSSHPNSKERIAYMEKLIMEQNLDRYTYGGVYRHQHIQQLVKDKWREYAKCSEKINTIEEAKICAGEKEQEN